MLAKKQNNNKKNEPHSEYACCSTSQPGRKHGTRCQGTRQRLPHRGGSSTGFSTIGKFFQPLGNDYWGERADKKTANPHSLTYEVSGHQLAMKWGQGCGCLFSIICSAVEQGQVWRGIRIEFQCLHHHRQTAWESLQVGIPRPMKLKEFHIDKKALFSY